jgi:hypothetical protein
MRAIEILSQIVSDLEHISPPDFDGFHSQIDHTGFMFGIIHQNQPAPPEG